MRLGSGLQRLALLSLLVQNLESICSAQQYLFIGGLVLRPIYSLQG